MALFMTSAANLQKIRSVNATDATFPARIPTVTEPTGEGVLSPGSQGQVSNNLLLVPYGIGADNTTFSLRLIGWKLVGTLWIPLVLCELACTLSAAVGVAGAAVVNTERFCDTITKVFGDDNALRLASPTGDLVAHVLVDLEGCSKFEVTFDMTGATSGNCLYASL